MFKRWLKILVLLLALTALYFDLWYAAHTPEYAAPTVFDETQPSEPGLL